MIKLYRNIFCLLLLVAATSISTKASAKTAAYYILKVYHFSNSAQEKQIEDFLENSFVPAMHVHNISAVGVFKVIANDTAADKKIVVLLPFRSLKQWQKFVTENVDQQVGSSFATYADEPFDKPAYNRIETIFLGGFNNSVMPAASTLTGPKNERVYELRSYESAGEKLHLNKVQMFTAGGEMNIFSRLNFHPVFYSRVIAGCKMPNLMYMTSFENMNARNEHWKAFSSDPAWKTLSGLPQYQHNVSKSEITFLHPTAYSDL